MEEIADIIFYLLRNFFALTITVRGCWVWDQIEILIVNKYSSGLANYKVAQGLCLYPRKSSKIPMYQRNNFQNQNRKNVVGWK